MHGHKKIQILCTCPTHGSRQIVCKQSRTIVCEISHKLTDIDGLYHSNGALKGAEPALQNDLNHEDTKYAKK